MIVIVVRRQNVWDTLTKISDLLRGPWPLSEVLRPPREAIRPSLKTSFAFKMEWVNDCCRHSQVPPRPPARGRIWEASLPKLSTRGGMNEITLIKFRSVHLDFCFSRFFDFIRVVRLAFTCTQNSKFCKFFNRLALKLLESINNFPFFKCMEAYI